MFPALYRQFPDGKIVDRDQFRKNKAIKRHGSAVVFMLDQMISEVDNTPYLRIFLQKAVEKHTHLKKNNMSGESFLVSNVPCSIFLQINASKKFILIANKFSHIICKHC